MPSEQKQFTHDYIERDGDFLVLQYPGARSADLSGIQTRMLENNKINGILPLFIEEHDLEISFLYKLPEFALSLDERVKRHSFSERDFYQFLIRLTGIFLESKNYMLKQEQYLFDKRFIYIGKDFEHVYTVYVPLELSDDNTNLRYKLKDMAFELLESVVDIAPQKFNHLRQYLKNEEFSLESFRQKMMEFLIEQDKSRVFVKENQEEKIQRQIRSFPEEVFPGEALPKERLESSQQEIPKTIKKHESKVDEKTMSRYVILAAILPIAGSWKIWVDNPSEGNLFISLGLTAAIINIAFIILKIWKPWEKKSDQQNIIVKDVQPQRRTEGAKHTSADRKTPVSDGFRQAETYTSSDETIIETYDIPKEKAYALYVEREGTMEKIPISRDEFVIGRSAELSNYTVNAEGVSRTHIVITKVNEQLEVKDLASKNGSYLNGKRMIPNKTYKLRKDDSIRIATVEYRIVEV